MKNKFDYIKKVFLIFFVLFPNIVLSDVLKFDASEIETFENGNLLKGSGGIKIDDGLGLVITGETFEFDKIQSVFNVKEKVLIQDNKNGSLLRSNHIIFFEKSNKIISKDKTIIELNTGQVIDSSNITYDRNLNKIFSKEKTQIIDNDNNKFNIDNFNFSIVDKVLTADGVEIKDNQGNLYILEKISYNLKTNEIIGKDLNLNFNSPSMTSNSNEPRLKGNAVFVEKDITKVSGGVFTTCKRNDDCPPWVLQSEEIKHDKNKKTFNYKNALLKIYNVPVLYFPKFFHPDYTVERQSGFLIPRFSQSNNLGNYTSTPYFFAISDSTDLTFSPRIYDNGKTLYQAEYRNYKKKSKHIVDLSIKNENLLSLNKRNNESPPTHFFLKSEFDLDSDNFDKAKLDLKIQQTSNDEYLKTYKLKSPLIESENILHSSLNLNFNKEDLNIDFSAETYENLNRLESDRYEYIFPSLSVSKSIKDFETGNLSLETSGVSRLFNTNIYEKTLVNDLSYKSFNRISSLGLVSNYEILIKNFNADSERSSTYKNKTETSLQSIINYEMKYPLQKVSENFLSTLTPTLSLRYSPNESKNRSKDDREIDVNNIFSINRIGSSDTVEGGQSITIGNKYSLFDSQDNNKEIFTIDLATSFRDEKNDKLPLNSTLGKKQSNLFGSIDFNANKFIDLNYNFSLDNDLKTLNLNQIKSTFNFNKFVSTFDFLEKSDAIGTNSYISNETKLEFNESSSLSFKTRKNKEKDLTEYYNLIYQYKNDCLVAGLEYKKDFYSDGSLKPDEQIFFSITIMPFGKVNSPNLNQK